MSDVEKSTPDHGREIGKLSGNEARKAALAPYSFKPGQSGNPAGKPKGSKHRLGEAFIAAMADDFAEHGVEAIAKVRLSKPHEYLKVLASLLPRQVELTRFTDKLTDDAMAQLIAAIEGEPSEPLEVDVEALALPPPVDQEPES